MKFLPRILLLCLSCASPLFASVTVTAPTNGENVTTSVHYVASSTATTCAKGVASMGVYVDNVRVYLEDGVASINTTLTLAPGVHHTAVQEWDNCGASTLTNVNITVAGAPNGVTVASPANGSTVSSPATYIATATAPSCAKGVASMGVYVDNKLSYIVNAATLNAPISLTNGPHDTVVQEWDYCGNSTTQTINVTVKAAAQSCPEVPVVAAAPEPFPATPPIPAPNPGSTANGSVCVSSPASGASVTSPMSLTANVNLLKNPIAYMRVYIDGTADYFTFYNQFTALLWMPVGNHTIEVIATDTAGNNVSQTFPVTVTAVNSGAISSIQNMAPWEPCSALYAPGTSRAGQICAAGNGNATANQLQDVASPSLSGSSSKFSISGATGYSNELWTENLGGGDNPTHFVYDLYYMIDSPAAAQALEFDVNQTINDTRWVFGSECNFNGNYPNVGEWDVWSGTDGWEKTTAPCPTLTANTWNHLVWTLERVGAQVHYVSLQVNNTVYPLNLYYPDQPNWSMGQINVAFQMDGNYNQTPYNVWLDKVNLTVY